MGESRLAKVARISAREVEEDFHEVSSLQNDDVASLVAAFDQEEVHVKEGGLVRTDTFFEMYELNSITLRYNRDPPFDEGMEEIRSRFADRSSEGHFSLKCVNRETIERDEFAAASAAAAMIVEAKILMNLEKHPHICQLYAMNAHGTDASFGSKTVPQNFFLLMDTIVETLPERMKAWREKKMYHEGQRFDDLAARQSQLTQRLEVALDICSALTFLSSRNIVYLLHPMKVGFDARYKRIKLFQFGLARESGKSSFFQYEENDMYKRVYMAPECLMKKEVTVSADVYAFGMLLWETMTLRRPFEGISKESHMTQVVSGRNRPHLNKTWPNNLKDLIEKCWSTEARPEMKQVYGEMENCLLFENLDGIDRTEDHHRAKPSKNRKIRYQPAKITEEERDQDSKSTRSKESIRSRESAKSNTSRKSQRSQRSNDSGSGRRKSGHSRSTNSDSPSRSRRGLGTNQDSPSRSKRGLGSDPNSPSRSKRGAGTDPNSPSMSKRGLGTDPNSPSRSRRGASKEKQNQGEDEKIRRKAVSSRNLSKGGGGRASSPERSSTKGSDGKIRRRASSERNLGDAGNDLVRDKAGRSSEEKGDKKKRATARDARSRRASLVDATATSTPRRRNRSLSIGRDLVDGSVNTDSPRSRMLRRSPTHGLDRAKSTSRLMSAQRRENLVRHASFKKGTRRKDTPGESVREKLMAASRSSTRESSTRRLGRNKSADLEHMGKRRNIQTARHVGRSKSNDTELVSKGCRDLNTDDEQSQEEADDIDSWDAFGEDFAGKEPQRGNLAPSRSGLLKPATKDTIKSNRERLSRSSKPDEKEPPSNSTNRPILVTAEDAFKKPASKRRSKSRRSLVQDTALLKEVFVDN